ncbi:MAG TPA: DUF2238 domain-containing protein [Anaerohalosphaeraceae bacterium]|nr:DUF2238 domain-containing protein [Phycisphaerae bacterium]HOK95937.1 DUF2238 domain-containing protein [Anaerohalosphaeraceae bacterium]HOL30629.1 DUF2238 domain-containing protein [Anaerohalosphaeraceae bacterium]HOM75294.1 DUF2238 domain-containing protein [Anaerohalosphaeraceae bacterium]HPC63106.1 DUF2238 domain-containing protein [Anaerohalosphaeraceae bacterium]
MDEKTSPSAYPAVLLAVLGAVFLWSAVKPADRFTWVLEMFPVVLALLVLIPTCRRFPLTHLSYTLILLHAVILLVGAHYTYAQVPLFNWIKSTFDLSRNHYDRIGHLAQGFVPAIVGRELLIRTSPLKNSKWLAPVVLAFCLSISALYELLEWTVAELSGTAAEAFLGTQGDVWDTQKDMLFCLVGAAVSLLVLSRWHSRQLRRLE